MEKRPTRKQAIVLMRLAGLAGDERARVRLLIESRVNHDVMHQAWVEGVAQRV